MRLVEEPHNLYGLEHAKKYSAHVRNGTIYVLAGIEHVGESDKFILHVSISHFDGINSLRPSDAVVTEVAKKLFGKTRFVEENVGSGRNVRHLWEVA